jgi:hypothetical protein
MKPASKIGVHTSIHLVAIISLLLSFAGRTTQLRRHLVLESGSQRGDDHSLAKCLQAMVMVFRH